jgi:hypothetical protein
MALFLPGGGPDLAPIPPLPGVSWIGTVGNIIGSILGIAFGGGSTAQLENQITQLRDQTMQTIHGVEALAVDIARALGAVLTWLHDLWANLLKWLAELAKVMRAVLKWLITDALPAIFKALRNLRQLLNQIYARYIRPALNYLQHIRRYLAILRALHVPFAGKLDAWIVKIEGRIVGPFLYVLRTVNGIGSWVNLIMTAGGVIQRPVFINTMYAYQRDWVNLWWAGQAAAAGPGGPPTTGAPYVPRSPDQVASDFQLFVTTKSGRVADDGDRAFAALQGVTLGDPLAPSVTLGA